MNEETFKQTFKFNIFENKDYENVGSLVKQTTLIGFTAGLGMAPFKFVTINDIQKKPFRQALPAVLGVVALASKRNI